jgi:flagellar hook-associated protein 1 FlgK
MSLSIGLDTAVKALRVHQLAVDVASHNISNANSPGFSRQRAMLRPIGLLGADRYNRDSLLGRAGMGVEAKDVQRVRDQFLDYQVRGAISQNAQYTALAGGLSQTELVFNDPTDEGMSATLGKFWAAWHDVVNDPESPAARTTLVHATETLNARFQRADAALAAQRKDLDRGVGSIGDEINQASAEIATLNLQIKQVELNGDRANDMRDRRDLLLDQLSSLAQITYAEQGDTTVTVYLASHELVTGNTSRDIKDVADAGNPGMTKLQFVIDGADVSTASGELRGILDARDVGIPSVQAKLDALAAGLITNINAIHAAGFGLDNTTGLNFLTGTDAGTIAINAVLAANPQQIAAASAANAPGDGSNALAIANLQQATLMAAGSQTFDEFYANTVSVLGADVSRAQSMGESADLLNSHLEGMRQSVAGVNIDEEVTNLNSAQHAYNAAARCITVIDSMLDTLINRTGVG